ncbi:MAG: glycosyltransferase family 39 protein [Burkholderiales bacterium]|nr:glycosyltransferase family 39 protein [Phycisphaerae bacterium]
MTPELTQNTSVHRALLVAMLIAICTFAAIAPTLTWPQFTGGNENIVVQTALEMRHGGPMLVPQMMGEPRVRKPPLVAWITALAMRQETIAALDSPKHHEQAYRDLAWQVRWTGLLAGCLLILATFELARVLFNARVGVLAALVVATNILFQKYMRQSTSDVHLALWVTIANAAFAHAVIHGRIWIAATIGMAATAIAFLCKGPVAIVETVVPWLAIICFVKSNSASSHARVNKRRILPVVCGLAIFCAIALPWFVHVYLSVPDVMHTWFSEVSRHGATDLEPSTPAIYLEPIPLLWPWAIMLIGGSVVMWRQRLRADWCAIAMVLVPIGIMIWFPDRKERYLLPMVAPLSIIAARGLAAFLAAPSGYRSARWVAVLHYLLLGAICIGVPLAGAYHPLLRTIAAEPWYSPQLACWVAVMFASLILLGIVLQRRDRWSLPITTFVAMLILQAVVMYGYRFSESGMSPMKPLAEYIRRVTPDAAVYDWNANGRRVDEDLAIYLNRAVLPIDPKTLRPGDRHQIYVTRQGSDDVKNKLDPIPPPGWMLMMKVKERKNYWWAFILPPTEPSIPPMQ